MMQCTDMKYTNMIRQIEGFKYSANIRFDLMDDTSLLQYIPTQHNLDLLSEIFYSITMSGYRNRQASKLIYGPYGSGKSHLITIVASIIGKICSANNYEIFIEKVHRIDKNLAESFSNFLRNSSPFFIVPIDGSFSDFHECIGYSLTRILSENGIDCIFKDPYLEAIKIIKNWDQQGNSVFLDILNGFFAEQKVEKQSLIKELSNFNPHALEIFENIFQKITCGVEYRPKLGNLYDNLDIVNETIYNRGYQGIVFIFDEFGKYLEDNMENINAKMLQDFAEYCVHGPFKNHLLLISHKQITQYTNSKDIEEWRKVESRFQFISFEQNDEDMLHLVSNILIKSTPTWDRFIKNYKENLKELLTQTLDAGFYTTLDKNQANSFLYGMYPLHPIVGQALNILSKKVAQNERTIFTFLASDEENSLGAFLRNVDMSKFQFVGIDLLYDYFEENISRDKNSKEYQEWLQTKNALNKLNNKDTNYKTKIKIIKAIGIINIINDFDLIKPDSKILTYVIDEDKEDIKEAIEELLINRIIVYVRQYKYYRFFDISCIDIEKLIEETMDATDNLEQAVDMLNSSFVHFPILPDKYNDKYKMTRYFYPIYILNNQIDRVKELLEKHYYDGLLVYLLITKDEGEIFSNLQGERVIYIIKKNSFEIIEDVRKLIAIEYLLTQRNSISKKDPKAIIELEEYKRELEDYIYNYTLNWSDPSQKDIRYVADGIVLEHIDSTKSLSDYMSDILEYHFDKALIVNNEMINKNLLSAPMRGVKREIIDALLLGDDLASSMNYGKLSANHTFIRSLLELNGVLVENAILVPKNDPDNLRIRNAHFVMTTIKEFIDKANIKELNFADIYHSLKSKPYGLRDGYIDVLLAAMLRDYRHQLYIRLKGIDQDINGALFERIGKYPSQYTLILDNWSKDKENYISGLETIYCNYININNRKLNRLKALHEGMLAHYKSVSKFSRTTHYYVEEITAKFRRLIEEQTTDFRDFFFNKLAVLGKDYKEITSSIEAIKHDLSYADQKLIIAIGEEIKRVFNLDNGNISRQLMRLYEEDWSKSAEHNIKYATNRFIKKIRSMGAEINEYELAKQLAFLLTGFDPLYWSDEQLDSFVNSLGDIYVDLKSAGKGYEDEEGSVQIILKDEEGDKKRLIFKRRELPDNGQILKNLISANINNFGQALSYEEKRQILYELLMEYA